MNDGYVELLVKKEQTMKDKLIKAVALLVVILMAAAGLFVSHMLLFVAAILGVAAYFLLPNLDLEFEYLYVNGELDIDRIASKTRRKRVKSLDLSKMEIMAPVKSSRMEHQNHNKNLKVYDYSSGNQTHKIYAIILPTDREVCKILIEPDEKLIKSIEKNCPRKVFTD